LSVQDLESMNSFADWPDCEHPLAEAIVAEAKRRSVAQLSATNFEALPGRGAKALVESKSVAIGGPRLVTEAKVTVPPEIEKLTSGLFHSSFGASIQSVADGCMLQRSSHTPSAEPAMGDGSCAARPTFREPSMTPRFSAI